MTSGTHSPSYIPVDATVYEQFRGIDRSRDRSAMDTGKKQFLYNLNNGYCDWRGRILPDAPTHRRAGTTDNDNILAVKFFTREAVCFAKKTGDAISLGSERGHEKLDVYTKNSTPSITIFRGKAVVTAAAQDMYQYDGYVWKKLVTTVKPAYASSISKRLAVAGMHDKPTVVEISRVNSNTIFSDDEPEDTTEVTKAFYIDVKDLIGTAEEIRALGSFSTNRLAIFTQERTLVYKIEEDYEDATIDENADLQIGCLSHRTVAKAGKDLLFCSRYGVHAVRRSDVNGIQITDRTLSDNVEPLYKELVKSVENKEDISAFYDPDEAKYHIFFPQSGGHYCKRLTYDMRGMNTKTDVTSWSQSNHLNARCGDALGGQAVLGTNGGVHNILDRTIEYKSINDEQSSPVNPKVEVLTPILWHGDAQSEKTSDKLIIQAGGEGTLVIEAFDEQGRELTEMTVKISDETEDESYPDNVLKRQYQLNFWATYKGLQLKITNEDGGQFSIMGIAVALKKEP